MFIITLEDSESEEVLDALQKYGVIFNGILSCLNSREFLLKLKEGYSKHGIP